MPSGTYPGVYIEEIPSGVRTITGVATSITAFVGRALRGPINEPVMINSFADFERGFGGLQAELPLGYAVRDFYQNGGSQAIIVRLSKKSEDGGSGVAQLDVNGLKLEASSPGSWANGLEASVDTDKITEDVAQRYNISKADLFNLTIIEKVNKQPRRRERFTNVSVSDKAGPRRVDRVLASESQLVRVMTQVEGQSAGSPNLPTSTPGPVEDVTVSAEGIDTGPLDAASYTQGTDTKSGLFALQKADLFNLLCIPPDARGDSAMPDGTVYQAAAEICQKKRAMLIVDPPSQWAKIKETAANAAASGLDMLGISGENARNAALYFPRVIESDPMRDGQLEVFAPCGVIAGVMARTDATRGVWKAPAGVDASLNGVQGLEVNLNDGENGQLNPLGINCLRSFPITGRVIWGARTLRGADQLADEYKYIPVRRLALFIEESLFRATQWIVFEPNDEPLWSQIRLNIGAFMHNLFRQSAFQGTTPKDAYFVKCDKDTTTQNDINSGIVNIIVGFAPLKPAEFVVIKLQQMAGDIQV